MEQIPIKVECHSGYRADEYPRRFFWDDEVYDIIDIMDRWYQGDLNPDFPAAHYFKVSTAVKHQYLLKHELEKNTWYLCK